MKKIQAHDNPVKNRAKVKRKEQRKRRGWDVDEEVEMLRDEVKELRKLVEQLIERR